MGSRKGSRKCRRKCRRMGSLKCRRMGRRKCRRKKKANSNPYRTYRGGAAMKTHIKQISYQNGEVIKLKNKRLKLIKDENIGYFVSFKTLSNDPSPRATHLVFKNKIVVTTLRITTESAMSLMLALKNQLVKDGIILEE
jgi:type IV secretory pathway VirB9-like protein